MMFLAKIPSYLKRICSLFLAAFMIGVSNVIMEEDRMINDTRAKVEQRQDQSLEE
ncbi:hypothetical protein ACOCEA_01015 [Maribacter sp. CXY002]|uniref:hypothetical protein n=1 Tax=Maribacter luteocoastalis TaxID=3407671 RepID=UPI003B67EC42